MPRGESINVYQADGTLLGTIGGGTSADVGGLVIYSKTGGFAMARLGRSVSTYVGEDAFGLGNGASRDFYWVYERGVLNPPEHVSWIRSQDAVDSYPVTSGSFVTTWSCRTEAAQAKYLKVSLVIDCPAGTTGEVYLVRLGGNNTSVKTFSANAFHTLHWEPGLTLRSAAAFDFMVRRTGGAGTISVHRPYPMAYGDFQTNAGVAGQGGGLWT